MASHLLSRRAISFFRRSKQPTESSTAADESVDEQPETQSVWSHLDENEINQIRNRSGLTQADRQKYLSTLDAPVRLNQIHQYKTDYVRSLYARYGRRSGLRPGVCWPRKDELDFRLRFDRTFQPSWQQLIRQKEDEERKRAAEIRSREKEIGKNLKNLEKQKADFFRKLDEKERNEREEHLRKEQQIQQVREYLGYSIDPRDPRFQEALTKKEEEEKAVAKAVVKKNKHAKLFEQLQHLIDSAEGDEVKSEEKKPEAGAVTPEAK